MINNTKLATTLIKLINGTKEKTIVWHQYSDSISIGEEYRQNRLYSLSDIFSESIIEERSYYYCDSNATFFLLAKSNLSTPLSGTFRLYLYLQLNTSRYSKLLAQTSSEESGEAKELSVSLRRLHNIIESVDPDYDDKINDYLDDFLKS